MWSMHTARYAGFPLLLVFGLLMSATVSAGQPAEKGDFRAETLLFGKGAVVNFVFNVKTGSAWIVAEKAKKAIDEEKAPGDGAYDFRTAISADDFWAFRIDRDSGKAWALREGKWVSVKDPAAVQRGNYEVFLRTTAKDVWIRRLNRGTGELWYCRWDKKDMAWSWVPLGK